MIKKSSLIAVICALILSLSGCGYTTRSLIDPDLKTIYIEPFVNEIDIFSEESEDTDFRTYYPFLERDITNSVIDRFIFDGNLRVVKKENADLILKGKLLKYQRDPVRYAENDEDVEEYRISLITELTLVRTKTDKEMWHEPNFVGDTTYFVVGASAKSEGSAISDAITDLSTRTVERVVENW